MGEEGPARTSRRKRYEPPVIWLWLAGRDLDEENGRGRTDATWSHDATRVFYPYSGAPVSAWAKMAHWKRSAIRQAVLFGVPLLGWDYWHHPVPTIVGLSALFGICAWHYGCRGQRRLRQFFPLKYYWQWVRPFRLTLVAELGIRPTYLEVPRDSDTGLPRGSIIGLPREYLGSDHERAAITKANTEILGIEAPDVAWRLLGNMHEVESTRSQPPPGHLWWDEIEPHILDASYDELVCGIGRNGQVVKVSIESDSPMFGIGMGSGAGKTNLLAFWLAQRLRLGDMGYMIDGKRFSHPYLFKDMDARRDQLPNIGYVRRIDDIHRGLVRLGRELTERNERAEHYINAKGHMLGFVGHRLWVGLEELNLVVPLLKIYWGHERERLLALAKEDLCEKPPKQSPALVALSQLAFAGRQVGIHLIFVGQRLDADVLGATGSQGGAVRGNINVRALARYDEPAWKMQAGGTPMPPPPSVTGRIQLWVGGQVAETQVPQMDYEQVRGLAVSGTVTKVPQDWPGVPRRDQLALPPVPVLGHVNGHTPHEQGSVGIGQGQETRPANLLTLTEAHAAGVFRRRTKQAVQRASTRTGFPEGRGWDGKAKLYDIDDLFAYQAGKELVRGDIQ